MSQMTIRERIREYKVVDDMVITMEQAQEIFTDACDMCRTGLGSSINEAFDKTWYQVSHDMERIIKAIDPDEGPLIIDEIRCFGY